MILALDFPFVIILVVSSIIFIFSSYYFNNKKVVLRKLAKHEAIPINRVQQNQVVKLLGTAKYVKEPLVAPISGRECIYYQAIVEEKSKNGWHTVAKEAAHQDFFIQVRDEMALIKADGPIKNTRMHLIKDHQERSGWQNDPTPRLELFLKRHGKKSTFLFMNRRLRYREGIVSNNEQIAVLGTAQWKTLAQPIEGYGYSKILTLTSSLKEKMIITDDPEAQKSKQK